MPLNNSQHELIMRVYEQKQLNSRHQLNNRFEELYRKIPELKELNQSIAKLSVEQARKLLNGDEQALPLLKERLRQLSGKRTKLLALKGFPENYLEPIFECPDCQDTGYQNTGTVGMDQDINYQTSEKCHCFKRLSIELLYRQSNLHEVLERENFSSFSLDYYSDNYIDPLTGLSSLAIIKKALAISQDFLDTFSNNFKNLFLYGDPGVGKTFLSHCIAKTLMDQSFSVIYFTAFELFDTLEKGTFKKDKDAELMSDHILDCDLLIIDDLGTELPNLFTTSQLFICVNERMIRRKSTIISTNLSLDDFKNLYSERVLSRITSNYAMLRLVGDDIRIKKQLLKGDDARSNKKLSNLGGDLNVTQNRL